MLSLPSHRGSWGSASRTPSLLTGGLAVRGPHLQLQDWIVCCFVMQRALFPFSEVCHSTCHTSHVGSVDGDSCMKTLVSTIGRLCAVRCLFSSWAWVGTGWTGVAPVSLWWHPHCLNGRAHQPLPRPWKEQGALLFGILQLRSVPCRCTPQARCTEGGGCSCAAMLGAA